MVNSPRLRVREREKKKLVCAKMRKIKGVGQNAKTIKMKVI